MDRRTIPDGPQRGKGNSARQQVITAAALAYREALYAFAEDRITWGEVLERCQRLRAALRTRRSQAAA